MTSIEINTNSHHFDLKNLSHEEHYYEKVRIEITQNGLKDFMRFCHFLKWRFDMQTSSKNQPLADNFSENYVNVLSKINEKTQFFQSVLNVLQLDKNSNHLLIETTEAVIFSTIEHLAEIGDISNSLIIESIGYEIIVKAKETEEAFSNFTQRIKSIRAAQYPEDMQHVCHYKVNDKIRKHVGFFLHSGSTLAHVETMLQYFKLIRQDYNTDIHPVVFVLSGRSAELENTCKALDINVVYICNENQKIDFVMAKKRLEGFAISFNLEAMIWICYFPYLTYFMYPRLTPRQIWWSHKFHSFDADFIDSYICRFPIVEMIGLEPKKWLPTFRSVPNIQLSQDPALVLSERIKFKDNVVLATFARSEVINYKPFLETVAEILIANPDTIYLWTGREENQNIKSFFESKNVLKQTEFIGWVNTEIYAQIIDIYLDTFHYGTGKTCRDALSAKKPALFYEGKNEFKISKVAKSIANEINEVSIENLNLFDQLVATKPEEYAKKCQALIENKSLRQELGEFCYSVAELWVNERFARTYNNTSFMKALGRA